MNRNFGIICLLTGIGFLTFSLLFSQGGNPNLGMIYNISKLEVVLKEGVFVEAQRRYHPEHGWGSELSKIPAHYEGRVAFPLKFSLAFSVLLVLIGSGMMTISKQHSSSITLKQAQVKNGET